MARILVVDDERDTVTLLQRILEREGFEVIKAYNGNEALSRIQENPVDLVILDVMMPGIDGYEVCKQIKSNPETSHIPVIFLSVRSSDIDIIKGLEYRAEDYITKPFNKQILLAKIKAILSNKMHSTFEKTAHTSGKCSLRIVNSIDEIEADAIFACTTVLQKLITQEGSFFAILLNEEEQIKKINIKGAVIYGMPLSGIEKALTNLSQGTSIAFVLDGLITALGERETSRLILRVCEEAFFSGREVTFVVSRNSITNSLLNLFPGEYNGV